MTVVALLIGVALLVGCPEGGGDAAGYTGPPEELIVFNARGAAAMGQQEVEKAITELKAGLAVKGDDPVLLSNLALAEMGKGEFDQAEEHLRAALAAAPDFTPAHFRMGVVLKNRGDIDGAIAEFEKVVDKDPYDVVSLYHLGTLRTRKGDVDGGIMDLEKALVLDPTHVSALYGLGRSYMQKGDPQKGQELIAMSQKIREETGLGETVGLSYGEQGKYSVATEYPAMGVPAPDAIEVRFAEMPGAIEGSGSMPLLTEVNGDGRPDLVLSGSGGVGLSLGRGDGGFDKADLPALPGGATNTRVYAGDLNNDGNIDLLVMAGDAGAMLWAGAGEGRFTDATAQSGLAGVNGAATALLSDVDHDGDLDLVFSADGTKTLEFRVNSGDGRFSARNTIELNEAGDGGLFLAASDFDNDRDVDIVAGKPAGGSPAVLVLGNRRDTSYDEAGAALGEPADLSGVDSLAIADLNKDGFMDVIVATRGGGAPVRFLENANGRGVKESSSFVSAASGVAGKGEAVAVIDYDNDGFLDVAAIVSAGGKGTVHLWRNLGAGRWQDVTETTGLAGLSVPTEGGAGLATADLDGDGDMDLIAGRTMLRNAGGEKAHSASVALQGLGDNRFGAGTKIEFRAGALWQKFEVGTSGLPVDMGLGPRDHLDAVRMLWPGGVLQDEIEVKTGAPQVIAQLDRKGTSCPILYGWDGEKVAFVTDFLGGSAFGYLEAPGVWSIPDTDEYVKIPGSRLAVRDGAWDLRLVNQLEETIYFDRAQLLVVDHPVGTEVFPNERLMPAPPYPPFRLFTASDARPPVSAHDGEGRDVLDQLLAEDRRTVEGFARLPYKGYAEVHDLILGLGPVTGDQLLLLLDGWIDYADSTSNLAASHAGLTLLPPSLDARRPGGAWRTVLPSMGFPAGLPKTMTVDLTGLLRPGESEVRIRTSMRIYWDRVRVATKGARVETRITRIDPSSADLRFLGFPREVTPDGRKPKMYDYSSISPTAPWKAHAGAYTRFGDVRELLQSVDDLYVTTRNGDEIALRFDAAAAPPLPEGWTRDFLLFTDGFGKDMDPNSARPDNVGPLPFHAMPSFPYPETVRWSDDPARAAFLDRYNTRIVPADPLGMPGASPPGAGPAAGPLETHRMEAHLMTTPPSEGSTPR